MFLNDLKNTMSFQPYVSSGTRSMQPKSQSGYFINARNSVVTVCNREASAWGRKRSPSCMKPRWKHLGILYLICVNNGPTTLSKAS